MNGLVNVPNVLKNLASRLKVDIKDGRIEIPEPFGRGYCAGYIFSDNIRLLISHYELKEELVLENPDVDRLKHKLFFKFQGVFNDSSAGETGMATSRFPSVLMGTSRVNMDEVLSIHSNLSTINIEVDAGYLRELFPLDSRSVVLNSLLENSQPLLFEQLFFSSLKKLVEEMITEVVDDAFRLWFYRIKCEELVCRLLMELKKREDKQVYGLNQEDIQSVYRVKSRMLDRLEEPPVLEQLASEVNMSPSKLKRLFKQIFGNSVFNYYQGFRMEEAARLLKEEDLSVSATGYQLGFTNLSHFTRVFYAHHGVNPKQFSKM